MIEVTMPDGATITAATRQDFLAAAWEYADRQGGSERTSWSVALTKALAFEQAIALASTGDRQGSLDVDRLAKAMATDHQSSQNHGNCTWGDDHRWYAEQVAAEYDRLSRGDRQGSLDPLPENACGVMGLCELRKGHEGQHRTSVDRALAGSEGVPSADPTPDLRAVIEEIDALEANPDFQYDREMHFTGSEVHRIFEMARAALSGQGSTPRMPTVAEFRAMGPERTAEWHRQSGITAKVEQAMAEAEKGRPAGNVKVGRSEAHEGSTLPTSSESEA